MIFHQNICHNIVIKVYKIIYPKCNYVKYSVQTKILLLYKHTLLKASRQENNCIR
jgi:hypothetical protein